MAFGWGWSFFLDQGRPVVAHALSEKPGDETLIKSEKTLSAGHHHLRFVFSSKGGAYAGGRMQIEADGFLVADAQIARTALFAAGLKESLDIGRDTGAPVTDYRTVEGKFEGSIEHVQLSFDGAAARGDIRTPD